MGGTGARWRAYWTGCGGRVDRSRCSARSASVWYRWRAGRHLNVAHPAHEEVPVAPEAEIAAAEPAEPEVLRKGKAVTEEEGEEKKEK